MNRSHITVIHDVFRIERHAIFYTNVFDAEVRRVSLDIDGQFGLELVDIGREPQDVRNSPLVIEVDDIEALGERIEKHGGSRTSSTESSDGTVHEAVYEFDSQIIKLRKNESEI